MSAGTIDWPTLLLLASLALAGCEVTCVCDRHGGVRRFAARENVAVNMTACAQTCREARP